MTRFVYIAGPYRAPTIAERDANIATARAVAVEAVTRGYFPICPHTMTLDYDGLQSEEFYLDALLRMVPWCDELWLVPGWEKSAGTLAEIKCAKAHGLPILSARV